MTKFGDRVMSTLLVSREGGMAEAALFLSEQRKWSPDSRTT
jgi:hypothetical protein